MAMRQFKAESKKLLDLMINSIYTNREIFLRELISNASDACDKRYFKSLTDTSVGITKDDLKIHIQPDKDSRTLTITDNGIGMTKEELEKNLGTIARSGSLDFKTENQSDNIDIIGQFGVGFYSAFMVAKKVTVISRAQGADTAWKWESTGVEGYTLTEADKEDVGTEIILVLKDDTDTDKYSEYLEDYELANLVKKYSDYIRFPITMYREKSRQKPKPEDAGDDYKPEYETYTELETLNSMVPIWKRRRTRSRTRTTTSSTRASSWTTPTRCASSPAGPRVRRPTPRCCSSRLDPVRLLHQGVREGSGAVCLRRYDHGEVCRPAAGLFQLCEGCCGQRGSESEHQP